MPPSNVMAVLYEGELHPTVFNATKNEPAAPPEDMCCLVDRLTTMWPCIQALCIANLGILEHQDSMDQAMTGPRTASQHGSH